MFEYEYISILNVWALKQENRDFAFLQSLQRLFLPYSLLCQMYANPPEAEFQGTMAKLRKRNKISSLLVYVLHKTQN